MRWPVSVLVLALIATAAHSVAVEPPPFCIIRYTPTADFQTLRVVQDLELNASELAAIADHTDADRDGTLTAAEVASYEAGTVENRTFDQLGVKKLTIDGRTSSARLQRELTGFEGPTATAPQRGKVQELRDHTFEPLEQQDQHLLEGGASASGYRVVVETVVFEAPAGWQLWSVNGTDSARGNTSVQISGFDTQTRFWVVFAKVGYDPDRRDPLDNLAPGLPLAVLALALALVALAARRR